MKFRYLVPRDVDIVNLRALNDIVNHINTKIYGADQQPRIWLDNVEHELYKGVINFRSQGSYNAFQEMLPDSIRHNESVIKYDYSYDHTNRVEIDLPGDGTFGIWYPRQDHYVKFSGGQVCTLPIYIPHLGSSDIHILEVHIAGSRNEVHKASRRYQHYVRGRKSATHPTGFFAWEWDHVADALGYEAVMYLVTTDGLVLKVTRAGMSWVHPTPYLPQRHFEYKVQNKVCVFASDKVAVYKKKPTTKPLNNFQLSMVSVAFALDAERLGV